ncbi:xanthine dehydrogenase family protein molybdopterin-binding subunit [Opitutales bacterium ASA1]|nr:xanthine dehydrogenase family protein molybdopterin-binding subunit [Opitutales bacterium ASA1]
MKTAPPTLMPNIPAQNSPTRPTNTRGADDYLHDVIDAMEGRRSFDRPRETVLPPLDRRGFLKLGGGAGLGLVLAFWLGSRSNAEAATTPKTSSDFSPNVFLRVAPDGRITILSKGPEIGQGIKTAFPLIVAEELDARWEDVVVEQAPVNPAVFGRQSAGGSRSIPASWDQLRQAGAAARAMLVAAAAQSWGVTPDACSTEEGTVHHRASGRSARYGELAETAATLPVPDAATLRLKSKTEYKLIGRRFTGVDNHAIVTGGPLFGIDQRLPGLLYAAYVKCPAIGGRVVSANVDDLRRLPGVKDAFVLEGTGRAVEFFSGVAVVATSTWAAFQAARQARVEWDTAAASRDSWTEIAARAREAAASPEGPETITAQGDTSAALAAAGGNSVEAFYTYPFVSHAPLEPQNCTAWAHDGRLEFWAPSQAPDRAFELVAGALGVAEKDVVIHQTRVGGGFGRRLMNDYMCEAGAIAQRVDAPVQLVWTREQDMAGDFFRVAGFHALRAATDATGRLVAWQNHFVTFSADGRRPVSGGNMPEHEFPAGLVPNVRVTQTLLPLDTPCGPWRAPRSNSIAWVVQSFLHEVSVAAGRDHLEFLLEIMGEPRRVPGGIDTARAAAVIRLAADKAGWGRKLPEGRGLGLAFHFSHAGHFAEVAEVSVDAARKLTVHRVVVAGDVGPIVNLSGAENQCEGAVVDAFSTMLGLEITMEGGRIQQSNFHDYPILRLPHHPVVETHFIQSDHPPTGIGEPALPPLAPAVTNAIFTACGHRVRTLPLVREGFTV